VRLTTERPIVLDTGVDIRRPIEEVFDYCVDLAHEPEWNPHLRRIEGLTPGRPRAGSRYVAEFDDGQRMVISYRGVDRPCGWISAGASDRLEATSRAQLTSDGDVTHLELHVEVRPRRGLLRYAGGLLRPVVARRERRNLANIKAQLEALATEVERAVEPAAEVAGETG
jgi:uncharacterized protein YndB with AHSA1/START domain